MNKLLYILILPFCFVIMPLGTNITVSAQADFWQESNGLYGVPVHTIAVNNNGGFFLGNDDGIYRSMENSSTWFLANQGLSDNTAVYSFAFQDTSYIFAAASDGIYRSADNGDSWENGTAGLPANTPILALAIDDNGYIFSGTEGDGVYRSMDNGDSWSEVNNGLPEYLDIYKMAKNDSGDIFIGTDEGVYRSSNSGESWQQTNTPLSRRTTALAINDVGYIYVGNRTDCDVGGLGVIRSTDNGESWTNIVENVNLPVGGLITTIVTDSGGTA